MNKAAYILAVLGAFSMAFYQVFAKRTLMTGWKGREALLTGIHMSVASGCLFLLGSCTEQRHWVAKEGFFAAVVATGVLNIGIQYFNMMARSLEDISLVAPIAASTPAIVIVAANLILGETVSRTGWMGILLLVTGTYILNMQAYLDKKRQTSRVAWFDWFTPFLLIRKSRGVRFAFASVLCATVSLCFDGKVARLGNVGFGFGCVLAIVSLGAFAIAYTKYQHRIVCPESSETPTRVVPFVLVSSLFALHVWISSYAYRYDNVAYVGTLKRLQIPLTIVLAYLILGEKTNFKTRLAGGTIMAAGAALLAFA